MLHRRSTTRAGWCLAAALALLAAGCVERTVTITSEPEGALVFLNDDEVGRTPVTVPFTFYGIYDVRLEHDGFEPLWTSHRADAPWWEAPGPDLFAEGVPHNRVHLDWHFTMQPMQPVDEDALLDRAGQLRASVVPPQHSLTRPAPATQPATPSH